MCRISGFALLRTYTEASRNRYNLSIKRYTNIKISSFAVTNTLPDVLARCIFGMSSIPSNAFHEQALCHAYLSHSGGFVVPANGFMEVFEQRTDFMFECLDKP
jgi:hypothetical protein